MKMLSGYIATCLWLSATMFMVAGTIEHDLYGLDWGVFLALVASGFATWLMSERRDHMRDRSVEHIAEVVDALITAKRDLRHLH